MVLAKTRTPQQIKFATIHHSAVFGVPENGDKLVRRLASHDAYHARKGYTTTKGEFGYTYLLYHFAIAGDGTIIQTQDTKYQRWHATDVYKGAESANLWGIGILIEGNFDQELPTQAQLVSAARVIRTWNEENNAQLIVRGHREFAAPKYATGCPGVNMGVSVDADSRLGQIITMAKGADMPPVAIPTQMGTVLATVLNIRKGPGTNFAKIGRLVTGNTVPVLAKSGLWLKIDWNGLDAWVHGDYVKVVVSAPEPDPAPGVVARLDELSYASEYVRERVGTVGSAERQDELSKLAAYIDNRRGQLGG